MKCKKCGATMERKKAGPKSFNYVCPNCGYTIKRKNNESPYAQAYSNVMSESPGRAEN